MPLYEYRCDACGHECEVLQGIHEPELAVCPSCSEPKLHRIVSRVSFRLKGGGWYETDFKKDGRKNVADDGSAKPSPGDGVSAAAGNGEAKAASGDKAATSSEGAAKPAASSAASSESSAKPAPSSPGTGSGS